MAVKCFLSLLYFVSMVLIGSLNCNSLRSTDKIGKINSLFSVANSDVFCLQETHWDDSFANAYKHLFSGDIFHSNGTHNSCGVATVVAKSLEGKVVDTKSDNSGRIIRVTLCLDNTEFDILNCYAPNSTSERCVFFSDLVTFIRKDVHTIMVGDLNVTFSPLDRSTKVLDSDRSREQFKSLAIDFSLKDIWRYIHPDKISFSWRRTVQGVLQQSRIDHVFMGCNMTHMVKSVYLRRNSYSDHK